MYTVAIDTETHCFRPGSMAPKIVCLSWASPAGSGLYAGNEIERHLHVLFDKALCGEVVIVGHEIAYDMTCILSSYPALGPKVWAVYDKEAVYDTHIRHRLYDIRQGKHKSQKYSLAALSKRYLGRELDKGDDSWRTRYAELEHVPLSQWPQRAVDYAIGDAEATWALFELQQQKFAAVGYWAPTQHLNTRAAFALKLSSAWGLHVDLDAVEKLWDPMAEEIKQLAQTMEKNGIAVIKPSSSAHTGRADVVDVKKSTKKIRALVEQHFPGTPPRSKPSKKFPNGQIQTGEEVIAQCNCPELQGVARFESLRKIMSTYLSAMLKGVVHPSYNCPGTVTDRTSSFGPNIQNQPKRPGLRECFTARKGYVYVACDYDALEMRTLGQALFDLFGSSSLGQKFREDPNFDPHLEFACNSFLHIPYASADKSDPLVKKRRQEAKAANFGFPGGLGAAAFVSYAAGYGVTLTESESKEIRDAWLKQWYDMPAYFDLADYMTKQGSVEIPRTGFVEGRVRFTQAANVPFQHIAACGGKSAVYETTRRMYNVQHSMLYGSRLCAFVHDELIPESPEDVAAEAAEELSEIMIEEMEKYTPNVPISCEAYLMRKWSKKAGPTHHDKDGRLVPWEE